MPLVHLALLLTATFWVIVVFGASLWLARMKGPRAGGYILALSILISWSWRVR